jgi:hypothetical protein
MDIAGATKAAVQIVTNPSLITAAPFVASKAKWDIQISGAYNLLIHKDFPNRKEIMKYVADKITNAFKNHNDTHLHNGQACTSVPDAPDVPKEVDFIKEEKIFLKYGEQINAKVDPKFDTIGYGV